MTIPVPTQPVVLDRSDNNVNKVKLPREIEGQLNKLSRTKLADLKRRIELTDEYYQNERVRVEARELPRGVERYRYDRKNGTRTRIGEEYAPGLVFNVPSLHSLTRFNVPEEHGSWTYGRNYPDMKADATGCNKAIREGRVPKQVLNQYSKQRAEIHRSIADLVKELPSAKRQKKMSFEGEEVDIDRVMVGDPNCWVKTTRNAKQRGVRVGIQINRRADDSVEDFISTAVRGVALVDALTVLGYTVSVHAICVSGWGFDHQTPVHVMVKLKDSKTRLDPQSLLTIALPSVFRNNVFGLREVITQTNGMAVNSVTDDVAKEHGIDIVAAGKDLRTTDDDPILTGAVNVLNRVRFND